MFHLASCLTCFYSSLRGFPFGRCHSFLQCYSVCNIKTSDTQLAIGRAKSNRPSIYFHNVAGFGGTGAFSEFPSPNGECLHRTLCASLQACASNGSFRAGTKSHQGNSVAYLLGLSLLPRKRVPVEPGRVSGPGFSTNETHRSRRPRNMETG